MLLERRLSCDQVRLAAHLDEVPTAVRPFVFVQIIDFWKGLFNLLVLFIVTTTI